jgi:hypothetical protein
VIAADQQAKRRKAQRARAKLAKERAAARLADPAMAKALEREAARRDAATQHMQNAFAARDARDRQRIENLIAQGMSRADAEYHVGHFPTPPTGATR